MEKKNVNGNGYGPSHSRLARLAFVGRDIQNGGDILSGYAIIFKVILDLQTGNVFDSNAFIQDVEREYGYNITTDVADEIALRFTDFGWLSSDIQRGGRRIFRINRTNMNNKIEEDEVSQKIDEFDNKVSSLFSAFRKFMEDFQTLIYLDVDEGFFEDVLIKWLCFTKLNSKRFILKEEDGVNIEINNEVDYICARFVRHLYESKKLELFQILVNLQTISIVNEVLVDVARPAVRSRNKTDLTVFLDAPVAMGLVGLSTNYDQNNAQYIVTNLTNMGVKVCLLDHSLEELRLNISAVLKEPLAVRYGPTGNAMKHRQVSDEWAKHVLGHPDTEFDKYNIDILPFNLCESLDQKKYFDKEHYDGMYNRLRFHQNFNARERDAKSAAFIVRRRKGKKSIDIFNSKCVMVTQNEALEGAVRRYCIEEGFIERRHVPPVVTQRKLAAAVWLAIGNGERSELSQMQLLSRSARLVITRPEVSESIAETLRGLDGVSEQELISILGHPKTEMLSNDLFLGSSKNVTNERAIQALEKIKENVVSKRIEEIQNINDQKSNEFIEAIKILEDDKISISTELAKKYEQDKIIIDSITRICISDINKFRNMESNISKLLIFVGLISTILLLFVEREILSIVPIFVSIGLFYHQYKGYWLSEEVFRRRVKQKFFNKLREIGRMDLLEIYKIDFHNYHYSEKKESII